jgi:hypothetical protein
MRTNLSGKLAVSGTLGVVLAVGLLSPAHAFFSRDHWFGTPNQSVGAAFQSLTLNTPLTTSLQGGSDTTTTNTTAPLVLNGNTSSYGTNGIVVIPDGAAPTNVVPEPSSVLLLGTGLVAVGVWRRQQRHRQVE